jgi:hypothetical protein
MQNRYVGDVGDYGKYALLRHLCGADRNPAIRLAVVWCLFPDETSNNDGKHISYLKDRQFAKLDPELHKALSSIVFLDRRHISKIAELGCLPPSTVFYTRSVAGPEANAALSAERIRDRAAWLHACLLQTEDCELVFFDPDNGLEIASVPKHHPKAGKYIYWDELARFWDRGHTLLIYHHLNRTLPSARQIVLLRERFASAFDHAAIIPLVFRRGSSRVFWLVHRGDVLGRELERRAADLLNTGWSRHFRPFGWPSNDHASTAAG